MGVSLHNAYSIAPPALGNEESILGIGFRIPSALSVFLKWNSSPTTARATTERTPLLMMQRQSYFHYFEAGSRLSLSRLTTFDLFFYHFNQPPTRAGIPIVQLFPRVRQHVAEGKRIDLGFGLFEQIFRSAQRHHLSSRCLRSGDFADSPGCRLMGREDEMNYGNIVRCPNIAASWLQEDENIWHKR